MWTVEMITRLIRSSAPVAGVPNAPLQHFLYWLPSRAGGDQPDLMDRIGRIKKAANIADNLWDQVDLGGAVDPARIAEARLALFGELFALSETRFWGRRRPGRPPDATVPAEGCGLLNVLAWIYERDAPIYKIVLELQQALATSDKLPDLMWALEVRCFVWPEKGPVDALVAAMTDVSIPWDRWAVEMINRLRAVDFWIPVGTKSLDKLRDALAPPGDGGGPEPLEERAVREHLERFHWKWFKLRDAMKVDADDQTILRRIIVFRKQLTNRLMTESVNTVAAEERTRFEPYKAVKYAVPGSTRLTSDIDVNMRGSATERVAIEFNQRFRTWTRTGEIRPTVPLESGYVFDVNVYAQDYTRDLGLRYMKSNAPGPDVWPLAGTRQWTQAEKSQDQYALIKMRAYMVKFPSVWRDFCDGVRDGLSPDGRREFADRIGTVDSNGVLLARQKETAMDAVLEEFPAMEAYADNVRTRAENNLYETQLREVYRRRGFGAVLDDAGKLVLIQELGKASYFAQEAYFTAGAVRDVVSNLQMGQGLTLSMYEQLHSFNEQVADIFKDLGHFPATPSKEQMLDFAVDASKYMARMATAALSASYEVVTRIFERQLASLAASGASGASDDKTMATKDAYVRGLEGRLNGLLDLQRLFGTWRDRSVSIMKIKDNPTAYKTPTGAWTGAAQTMLDGAPWSVERVAFTNAICNLAIVMNVEARSEPTSTMRTGLAGQTALFRTARAAVVARIVTPSDSPAPRGKA